MKISFQSPPAAANESGGLAVPYAPARRQLAQWRWRLLVLLVLSPLLVFLGRLAYGSIWAEMPGFVIIDQAIVKAPMPGRLVHAPAVGSVVRAGDTIGELANDVLENEHRVLSRQRERVLQFVEPPVEPSAQIPLLRELARQHGRHYDSLRALSMRGAATQAEVAGAHGRLAATLGQLRSLEQEYALALRHQRPAGPPPPPARLLEVEARLQALRLKAPASGVVAQVFGNEGEWFNENAEVIDIRMDRPARIEVYVEPGWARYARAGRQATIIFLDGYTHRARVKEVKMSAQRLPADRANPLTVRHHSIIAMLEPEDELPEARRIHLLPVNVRFDL